MLVNLLFVLIMSSGAVYLTATYKRRFEEMLILSVMSMVMILFLFGVAGYLAVGITVLLVASVVLYILTLWHVIKGKEFRVFLKNMVTPGSVFFMILCGCLSVWNFGMQASKFDEFTHWMDIVKVVSAIDDFGTNPAANVIFSDYPPAMLLFQYAHQKIYFLMNSDAVFSEWRVYFCYQIFIVVVLLPFFRNTDFRHPLRCLVYGLITLIAPLMFYTMYDSVYMDLFVGVLFGSAMAMIFLWPLEDIFGTIAVCLTCCILALSKDVGLLLSGVVILTYCTVVLLCHKCGSRKCKLIQSVLPLFAVILAQSLWNWEVSSIGASETFTNEIQLSVLLDVILGRDTTYRTQVFYSYWHNLNLDGTGAILGIFSGIRYFAMLFIMWILLYCVHLLYKRVDFDNSKKMNIILVISAIALVGYIIGLCVMYMFKFSEYEALELASINRYLNIVFVGVWLLILLSFAQITTVLNSSVDVELCLILAILLFAPSKSFVKMVKGDYINDAQWFRAPYENLRQQMQDYCDGDDRIFLITDETFALSYHVFQFNARPNLIAGWWSIGSPSDIWNEEMSQESRQKLLNDYDYVALYRSNDYFSEHFSELFETPENITADTLYRIDRESGLLEKCDLK